MYYKTLNTILFSLYLYELTESNNTNCADIYSCFKHDISGICNNFKIQCACKKPKCISIVGICVSVLQLTNVCVRFFENKMIDMSQFLSIHLHLLWKTIFHYQCFQYKHRYLFLSALKLFFIRRFYNYPEIQRIEPSGVKSGTYLGCKCNSSDPHPQSLKMLFLSDSQFHKSRDVPLSLWGICLHSGGRICLNRTGSTNFLETLFQVMVS